MPPFDGNGNYSLPTNSFAQPVTGTTIDDSDAASLWADLSTALSTCVVDNQTSSPSLLNPKILTKILDTNSNELVDFATTGSAVNNVRITNAATGNAAKIDVTESNTNLELDGNGTGSIITPTTLLDANGNEWITHVATGSAVNEVTITNSAAGNPVTIAATGDDTNIDIGLVPKGSGGSYGSITTHASSPFATTSGTSVVATSIPSWVKRITIAFNGVSTDGTAAINLQIGDAGGLHTTGYDSAVGYIKTTTTTSLQTSSIGFNICGALGTAAADLRHGHLLLTLADETNHDWVATWQNWNSTAEIFIGAGNVSLDTALTQLALVSTDTFDAGEFSVHYEG